MEWRTRADIEIRSDWPDAITERYTARPRPNAGGCCIPPPTHRMASRLHSPQHYITDCTPCPGSIPGAGHLFRYVTNQPPKANSAVHPSGVGKWVPASAGKAKAGMVHSTSGWTRGVQVTLWDPLRTVPYLSALEVCSRWGAIQIHVYLALPYLTLILSQQLQSSLTLLVLGTGWVMDNMSSSLHHLISYSNVRQP